MPNKCTRCGKIHPDDAEYLMNGCDECGSKFFFYIKEDNIKEAEEKLKNLDTKEIGEIEKDVRDILKKDEKESYEDTVVLDIESIRITEPGKYEIDLNNLFSQDPIIIRVGQGKYKIDLSSLNFKWRKK